MSALEEDLRRVALAAVSEANRSQRWADEDEISADLDELAARRRLRDETDRYQSKAEWEQAVLEDQDGPF